MGASPEPAYLVVGQLTKPHGTKGELLVWPLTDRPEEVFAAGQRVLAGDMEGEPGSEPVELVVAGARPYKKGLLAAFESIDGRDRAAELAGRYLLVPAAELAEPEEDEVYYHQLLGLAVETTDGERVGRVREVFETEPTHLLEVKGESKVHLVPFTSRIVTEVDLERGRLVIDPPEGLLDV